MEREADIGREREQRERAERERKEREKETEREQSEIHSISEKQGSKRSMRKMQDERQGDKQPQALAVSQRGRAARARVVTDTSICNVSAQLWRAPTVLVLTVLADEGANCTQKCSSRNKPHDWLGFPRGGRERAIERGWEKKRQ